MDIRLKRTPGIYLVGFMGSGKTTVGKVLAKRLGWAFADLDDDIEAREGVAISEIFEARGEEEFRRIETEVIRARVAAVESGRPLVAALGGGAFTRPENCELLRNNGITMWLDCPFEIVVRRVAEATHRPLARDPERFAALYRERAAKYACADFRIEVKEDTPDTVTAAILELPIFR
jgi:shikimate kinase